MNPRPLLLPAALLLSLLGLGTWAYEVIWRVTDVRVVNRSQATLLGLRVCLGFDRCAERTELGAEWTWRVPLKIEGDNGAVLAYDGLRDERHANTYVSRGLGVHWIVRPGGEIEPEQ